MNERLNDELNKKLLIPVCWEEVVIAGELVEQVHQILIKTYAERNQRIKKIDSNIIHFIIYKAIEQSKDEKIKNLPRGWFKHGPYVPAVDSYLVLSMNMEEHQHQQHKECKEEMCDPLIEIETL